MNWDIDTPGGMENAMAWQERMLSMIKPGGSWIVPRSNSIYTIYPDEKIAVRVTMNMPDTSIDRVFDAMGWTIKEAN